MEPRWDPGAPGEGTVPAAVAGERPHRWFGVHDGAASIAVSSGNPGDADGGGLPDDPAPGVHVVLSDDPAGGGRAVAERLRAPLVTTAAAAEQAIAGVRTERRVATLAAEAAEATRLASLLTASRNARSPSPAAERNLVRTVQAGRAAEGWIEQARRLEGPRAAALDRLGAAERAVEEAAAGAASCPPGLLAAIPAEVARAAAGAAVDARRAAEQARQAVGDQPPDPAADVREVEQLLRSEVDVTRQLRWLKQAETFVSPFLAFLALVAGLVGLWLALAHRLTVVLAVVLPAAALGARAALCRWLETRHVELLDTVRAVLIGESDAEERREEHAAARWQWLERSAAAARAEEAHDDARRAWEALTAPGLDPERIEELLAHEDAARQAAAALAAAEAELEDVRAGTAAPLAAWVELLDGVGLPHSTEPSRCIRVLERRRQRGEDAAVRQADIQARAEAASRLRALLHGRRLERLLAEAAACPPVDPSPRVVVLADPLAALGPGRRRQLLRDLVWWGRSAAVVLVTSDAEAARWAEEHGSSPTAPDGRVRADPA